MKTTPEKKRPSIISAVLLTALLALAAASSARGQGSAADYERAREMQNRVKGKVLNEKLEATWIVDHQVVYRRWTAPERWECWLAAAKDGRELVVYRARKGLAVALIDGKQPDTPPGRKPPRPDIVSPDGKWVAFLRDFNVMLRGTEAGEEIALTSDGSADNHYTTKMAWSPDSTKLAVIRIEPAQQHTVHLIETAPKDQVQPKLIAFQYLKPGDRIARHRPVLFDVPGRKPIPLFEELFDNPWSINRLAWLPDSSEFTFLYNQRGHQVLRLIGLDGGTGAARAIIDERSETFVDYAGKLYLHRLDFSPNREYYVDTYSRVDLPPVHELRRSSDGSLLCELERADWTPLLETGWRPPERFKTTGRDGETDIWGIIITPSNFDPEKKYPVIESIYAGPHGHFVPKSFGAWQQSREIAELGFVVVHIDGMGTNWRSKAFHDVCWKNLGDSGFPDRIEWMKAAARSRPYMDLERVGIYGGSAGGQSALRALLAHGDFYDAAVTDCGCHDNRMDKVWWNELWMGWPVGPHYAEQSNVTNAHRLEGDLLLIVGELDRNVDPASTMQVVDALIEADKDFDLLVIPGAGHGSAESPYGKRRRQDFFVRHLLAVEPRWE